MPRSQSEFNFDDTWGSLSSGWSSLATLASKAGENALKVTAIATQKAAEIAGNVNDKVKEGSIGQDFKPLVTSFGSKVADASKRGWTDLSTMFGQKASMYHDPNDVNHSLNGGFNQGGGFYDSGLGGSSSTQNNGYNSSSLNDFYSEEAVEEAPFATNLRPSSNNSSKRNSPKVSAKNSSLSKTSNSGLSREEKTLVELEGDIKPKKAAKKPQPKSLEDEFWAQLEEEAPKSRKK
jgi:hypothetical protein